MQYLAALGVSTTCAEEELGDEGCPLEYLVCSGVLRGRSQQNLPACKEVAWRGHMRSLPPGCLISLPTATSKVLDKVLACLTPSILVHC